jgi:hypothetical protein
VKKMNVMIPEIHEKMWTELLRLEWINIDLANASDYRRG